MSFSLFLLPQEENKTPQQISKTPKEFMQFKSFFVVCHLFVFNIFFHYSAFGSQVDEEPIQQSVHKQFASFC